jgi:hypothetical protein
MHNRYLILKITHTFAYSEAQIYDVIFLLLFVVRLNVLMRCVFATLQNTLSSPVASCRYVCELLPISSHHFVLVYAADKHIDLSIQKQKQNKLRSFESASELYRLSDRHLSSNFSANFCGWRGVALSARWNSYGRHLSFPDRSRYFFFYQVAPQLSSWGWVKPVPDPLLLRKSGIAVNRTRDLRVSNQEH